jgi:signal recognition particle GTPase
MNSMNRASALRKCLDKLDDLDEALIDVGASVGSVEDFLEALKERFQKHKVPAPEEVDAIEAFFDILEKNLNNELKGEESTGIQVRNPHRRR